ncbi:putative membrane protein [Plasmodium gaboni]|uniref:Putative membrane protein n=1 Tax=Plasmodium gaboni TaxID=647221 RepID=A0A151LH71_9APIC|nr:putative membrane protein [Plasmodium gaboni]KYN98283.1 putative membrane protein [Plasmodium gaboni]
MKNETQHFFIVCLFDIAFFAVCVCIWLYLRKNRDENKINDNIYILNHQTHSELKIENKESVGVTNDENNTEVKKKTNRFRTFLNIKDDKIVNTEIKYYLFFLKANRNIIFSLCILGTFLVLPLYLSLPRNDINNPSFFHYISAGSISDINILTILYFITLIYSAISYAFIYLLWRKIRPSKKKTKKFLPQNFTIMVSRIDKKEINAYKIYEYFCNLTNNKVVSAYLILDYSIVYHEQKKIFNATKNLKLLKENEEKKNIKREKSRSIFFKWTSKKKKKKNASNGPLQICDKNTNQNVKISKNNTTEGNQMNNSASIQNKKAKNLSAENNNNTMTNTKSKNEHSKLSSNDNIKNINDDKRKKKNQNDANSNVSRGVTIEGNDKNNDTDINESMDRKIKKATSKGNEAYKQKSASKMKENEILEKKEKGKNIKKEHKNGVDNYDDDDDNDDNDDNNNDDDDDDDDDNDDDNNDDDNNDDDNNDDDNNDGDDDMKNIKSKRDNDNVEDEPACYLKDTTDEELVVEKTKLRKKKNAGSNYSYKLDLEEKLMRSTNNDMLFYDLDNLSTKDNDNIDIKYKKKKKKNLYKSDSKTNFFDKIFFFLKKNKKSHWKKKLKEHLIKFYSIKNETPKKSTGVCFVSFIDTKSVHDCIHNIPFTERNKWVISNAPPNYDIIWKNLKNDSYKVCARFIILNALLLLANTIMIISVTSIDNILKLKIKKYKAADPSSSNLSAILTTWLSPFIVIFVNSIIQPALISCVSMIIGFIRKSSEHTYVLQGNFIFLILNTIIIPLLSLSPLSSIIKVMYSDEIGQWSTRLGEYLFNSSGFFAMRYLLHCCFLTCANQLLQIPQFSIRSIFKILTKKEISAWTFDFGYWYGFNTSILALILTFSVAVPFILPLGSLYFFLRYYIDKYNLIYEICRTNLDSHGAVVRTAIKFMLFSVAFFQLVMFTFFSRVQNKFISVGRNILFLSSSLTTLLLLCRSTEWVSTNHIKRKKGKRTFCYLCEKNVYVSNLKDLNKLKYAYANPCESKR